MSREMYYVNHLGTVIRFDGDGFRINEHDLRNFQWDYTVGNKPSGIGGSIQRFFRQIRSKKLTITARGRSAAECRALLNAMHAATEVDIAAMSPGRFYLDGQYLTCYLCAGSELLNNPGGFDFAQKSIELIATHPMWCEEETKIFRASEITPSSDVKRYNLRYPYKYGTGYYNNSINNTHYLPVAILLTIWGPCTNPAIIINGVQYGVETNADAGERIVIDQLAMKIYKVGVSGARTNVFNTRYKAYDQFARIPAGMSQVLFNGSFGFDVTMIRERSEPKWI